jgi:hypothetical protein
MKPSLFGEQNNNSLLMISKSMSSPPVMKAPITGIQFRLYIAAEDVVIEVVLTQVIDGKEHTITYLTQRLIDVKTRYSFMKNYVYPCCKLRHYLLSSTCIVACHTDVIKHILQQLILSGIIEKWAYALIEYDLAYEPLKSRKYQGVADFIVEHSIDQNSDELCNLVPISPWKLFFDDSACREGHGVGVVLISPRAANFETSACLEYFCTNNQAEYEAILLGL